MLRKILIVDDMAENRQVLRRALCQAYEILEAGDGGEALEVIGREYETLSAVLLDIGLPVMDGYEALRRMRENPLFAQIPVLVLTGNEDEAARIKALELGANDFLAKPYSPAIIQHSLRNNIRLREASSMVNALRKDALTGLYNRETFFSKVEALVRAKAPGYYVLTCFDINNFKVVNDRYGNAKGDEALKAIAKQLREGVTPLGGVCARITADRFAALYPSLYMDSPETAAILEAMSRLDGSIPPLRLNIGCYLVDDLTLSVSAMYDRANIAQRTIKGRYDIHVALYDESMRTRILREQAIVGEMNGALACGQFEVWFQPQYNHATGALIGAEALVRWRHPKNGLIPPAAFIPVFERNGFVYELDKYVWEKTCAYLRKWMDEGRTPLPVSVNISRVDIFRDDFIQTISQLVDKYGIPADLLRLEITESAFAESTERIVRVVKRLISNGFTLEIDDFGSGYSSLNTLKDVPAQVIKLDMRFLEGKGNNERGGNILESVVRMSMWLGMSVIAEGVETIEQADYLKTIGCNNVQGYLYARPMPPDEYEKVMEKSACQPSMDALKTLKTLDNNAFWDPLSMETLIFNSYVGGACILEYHNHDVETLRANDKYAQVIGGDALTHEDALSIRWKDHLDAENRRALRGALERAIATGDEVTGEYAFTGIARPGETTHLRVTMRMIAKTDSRYLIYCTNENITAQKLAERALRETDKQLRFLNETARDLLVQANVELGINEVLGRVLAYFGGDRAYVTELDYGKMTTRNTYEVCASGIPGKMADFQDMPFDTSAFWYRAFDENRYVQIDDVPALEETRGRETLTAYGINTLTMVPMRCDDRLTGIISIDNPVRNLSHVAHLQAIGDYIAVMLTRRDLNDKIQRDAQAILDLMNDTPGGFVRMRVQDNGVPVPVYANEGFLKLVGMTLEELLIKYRESALWGVHPEDLDIVLTAQETMLKTGEVRSEKYRLRHGEGGYVWVMFQGRVSQNNRGETFLNIYYTDVAEQEKAELSTRETLRIALRAMMAASSDLSFVKDKTFTYICCSRAFAGLVGLPDETLIAGKTDFDLFPRDVAAVFRADDEKLMATREALVDYIERVCDPGGAMIHVKTSKYLLYNASGDVIGLYGIGHDITRIRERESQLALLAQSIPGGLATYVFTPKDMKITYFNDGFCQLFGYTRREYERLSAEDPTGRVFEEDIPALMEQIGVMVERGTPVNAIYRAHVKGGGYKWISHHGAVADRNGEEVTVNAALFDVTAQQEATQRLRISEEEYRLAMQHSGNLICRYDIKTKTLTVSPDAASVFSQPETIPDVPDSPIRRGVVSPESAESYLDFYARIRRGEKNGSAVFQIKTAEGWRWMEGRFSTIFANGSGPVSAVISFVDVTGQLEKEAAFKRWRQSLLEKAPETYTLFRGNLSKDTAFETVECELPMDEPYAKYSTFNQRTLAYARRHVCPEDQEAYIACLSSDTLLANYHRGRRGESFEYREMRDGRIRWLRVTIELVEHPNSKDVEAYLMYEDIDERKRAALLTLEQAKTDPLTGVLNRAAFIEQVERLMRESKNDARHALMMLDVDGFKKVNDVFGHAVGDQALIDMAKTLRCVLRRDDAIGRLGGDEFFVLLRDVPGDAVVAAKAQQICALLNRSVDDKVSVTASIGIAMCPRDGVSFDALYNKADRALYKIKGAGKNDFTFYQEDAL